MTVGQESESMASLWALLPAPGALSAYQWLTRLALGLGTHDPRTMDARRADLLVDLLTGRLTITGTTPSPASTGDSTTPGATENGGHVEAGATQSHDETRRVDHTEQDSTRPSHDGGDGTGNDDDIPADDIPADDTPPNGDAPAGPAPGLPTPVNPGKPLVQVVMPHSTLIGADDQPCELVGYGAIPADLAREIAADAVWKRLITDPMSGALLDHGRTTYRPPAALADFVRARDVTCRFPTCQRRAIDAELDHALDWAHGGTTGADDLPSDSTTPPTRRPTAGSGDRWTRGLPDGPARFGNSHDRVSAILLRPSLCQRRTPIGVAGRPGRRRRRAGPVQGSQGSMRCPT